MDKIIVFHGSVYSKTATFETKDVDTFKKEFKQYPASLDKKGLMSYVNNKNNIYDFNSFTFLFDITDFDCIRDKLDEFIYTCRINDDISVDILKLCLDFYFIAHQKLCTFSKNLKTDD